MAYARRRRFRRRRGRFKRKRRSFRRGRRVRNSRRRSIARKVPGRLSQTTRTKVYFNMDLNRTTGAGTISVTLSGNNLTDIDGSGAQPLLFSTYMAMYRQYKVYGSRIKFTVNPFGTATDGATLSLFPASASNPSPPTTASGAVNQPFNRTIRSGPMGNLSRPIVISNYLSTKVLDNVKDLRDEDDYQGTETTGPNIEWFWHFLTSSQSGPTSATISYFASVNITYYVDFYDRVIPQTI